MPKIITIAREYGSGGRIIAQKVANLLGLVYYDNQIIDLAAQELGFDIETIRKAAQEKSSGFLYGMAGGTFQMPLMIRSSQHNLKSFVILQITIHVS